MKRIARAVFCVAIAIMGFDWKDALKIGAWVVNPKLGLAVSTGIDAAEVTQELIEANKKKKEAEAKLRKIQEEERQRLAAEAAERRRIFNVKLTGTRHMSGGKSRIAAGGTSRIASRGLARVAKSA